MFLIYPPEESNVYIQESKDGELEGMDRCRALNVVKSCSYEGNSYLLVHFLFTLLL